MTLLVQAMWPAHHTLFVVSAQTNFVNCSCVNCRVPCHIVSSVLHFLHLLCFQILSVVQCFKLLSICVASYIKKP